MTGWKCQDLRQTLEAVCYLPLPQAPCWTHRSTAQVARTGWYTVVHPSPCVNLGGGGCTEPSRTQPGPAGAPFPRQSTQVADTVVSTLHPGSFSGQGPTRSPQAPQGPGQCLPFNRCSTGVYRGRKEQGCQGHHWRSWQTGQKQAERRHEPAIHGQAGHG